LKRFAFSLLFVLALAGCSTPEPNAVDVRIPVDVEGVVEGTPMPTPLSPSPTPNRPILESPKPSATPVPVPLLPESPVAAAEESSEDDMADNTTVSSPPPISSAATPPPAPTPEVIIKEVPVELPPQIVEVVKEVQVPMPLDGMDMRERVLTFREELNVAFEDTFGLKLDGGEYCYGFTSHTEYLIGYHFIRDDGELIFSYRFPPLSITADQATMEAIMEELAISQNSIVANPFEQDISLTNQKS
jgi:hypothetical protein